MHPKHVLHLADLIGWTQGRYRRVVLPQERQEVKCQFTTEMEVSKDGEAMVLTVIPWWIRISVARQMMVLTLIATIGSLALMEAFLIDSLSATHRLEILGFQDLLHPLAPSCSSIYMPRLHDAYIVGLRLDGKDRVLVTFRDDVSLNDLLFSGVQLFHAEEFQTQNIACDLVDTTGPDINVERVYGYLETVGIIDRESAYAKDIVLRLQQGKLHLFELEPSLGCWFVCIAEICTWENVAKQ
jgi:hypothetical protein